MPTTVTWAMNAGGDWGTAADWSTGQVPGSANSVTISTTTLQTITYSNGDTSIVNSLSVGQDQFAMSGGSLQIVTTGSFADGLVQSGGVLLAGSIGLLASSALTGGSTTGTTALNNTGTLVLSNYALGGSASLTNTGTTQQTGWITVGDPTGVTATIRNQAGATYDFMTDDGIAVGATSARFVNSGTLEKTSGTGTSIISVDFTNSSTGTIIAASGDLQFVGQTNTIAGTLNGAGEISFAGGLTTLAAGTSITAATFGILASASIALAGNLTVSNLLDTPGGSNSTMTIGAHTLTLAGTAAVTGNGGVAIITGSGTLRNSSTLSISGTLELGGTLAFINNRKIIDTGTIIFGDGSGVLPAATNAATGSLAFATDVGIAYTSGMLFTNVGTLSKSGGTGTSLFADSLTDTGTITGGSGLLDFQGPTNSLAGTINGTAAVALDANSVTTLQSGLTIGVATLDLFGYATLILAANQNFARSFNDVSSGITTIDLGSSQFTLSGLVTFNSTVINGAGTLATAGKTTLSGNDVVLGGTATWSNTGTIYSDGVLYLGDGSGSTVTFINGTGGIYDINGLFETGIDLGLSPLSSFTNAGVFEQTAGTGGTEISADFVNTGTVVSNSGTIDFRGPANTVGGKLTGSATITFSGAGVTTLQTGVVLSVGTLDLDATIMLATDVVYTDTLNLNSSVITGTHTLATSGVTTVYQNTIGGTAVWINGGSVNPIGNVVVSSGSGAAQFINKTHGVYDFQIDNAGVYQGPSTGSKFTNNGLLEKTNGLGTDYIGIDFINTGVINVQYGTIDFTGVNNVIGGTLIGSGTVIFDVGTSTTLQSGGTISVQTIDCSENIVSLAANQTISGTLNVFIGEGGSATIDLGGNQLQMAGAFNVIPTYFAAIGPFVIDGSGELITSNISTLGVYSTVILGGTAIWSNTGTIDEFSTLQLGDGSGDTAQFINQAGGIYDFVGNYGIDLGTSDFSGFTNDGLFEQTAGTSTSGVSVPFVNNGTIDVITGSVEFAGYELPDGTWASRFTNNGVISSQDVVSTDQHADTFITAPYPATTPATDSRAETAALTDHSQLMPSNTSFIAAPAAPYTQDGAAAASLGQGIASALGSSTDRIAVTDLTYPAGLMLSHTREFGQAELPFAGGYGGVLASAGIDMPSVTGGHSSFDKSFHLPV